MGTEYESGFDLELNEEVYEYLNPEIELNWGLIKFSIKNDNYLQDYIFYNLNIKGK